MKNLKTSSLGAACLIASLLAAPAPAGEAPAPAAPASPPPPEKKAPAAVAETGGAAAAPTVRVTLEEAVRMALASAERIGAARASLERSDAAVLEAYSGILPSVSASGSLARSKREIQTVNGIQTPASRYANLYSGTVQLSQPLFTGGAVYYGVKAARSRRGAASEDVRTASQTTIFNAAQDYYNAVLNREVLAVVRNSYELAKSHFKDVQAREAAGTASKFDVLRAKVAMQNQEAQVISAENDARLSVATLLREIGMPQDTRLELVTEFGAVGATPRVEEALRTALANRPELASAELTARAQRNSVSAARSGYLPKLSGSAAWGGTSTDDPLLDDNFVESGSLGVQVQWNVFDGALTRARVAEARADLERLQWQERGLRKDVELQVRQAVLNLESARTFIESQGANVEEAAEALRLAEARQKAGAGTELDVQDARNALEQARLNYVQSLSQYATARLALKQATGTLAMPEEVAK